MPKTCKENGCKTQPNFGLPGKKAEYCKEHSLDGMDCVTVKKCKENGCKTIPTFGLPGKKAEYCKEHSLDGMDCVTVKKCKENGCKTRPNFGLPGKKAEYCKEHSLDGMENVKDKTCKENGCKTRPNFGLPGKKAEYCKEHSLDGMEDLKNKTCKENGCKTQPTFGLPGKKAEYCSGHKKEEMMSNPNKTCLHKSCKEIAIYGIGKASACENHKEDCHINLVERKCVKCDILNILDKEKLCEYCNPNEFNKRRLAKQRRVKISLDAMDFNIVSYDKRLDDGKCGNERPDFVFESTNKTHFIVLEVDEDQHMGNNETCECTRMVNISQSFGQATIFIRYNPDEYKVGKTKHNPSHNNRMELLKKVLKGAMNLEYGQLSGFCSLRKIYFNDYVKTDVNYYSILDFER